MCAQEHAGGRFLNDIRNRAGERDFFRNVVIVFWSDGDLLRRGSRLTRPREDGEGHQGQKTQASQQLLHLFLHLIFTRIERGGAAANQRGRLTAPDTPSIGKLLKILTQDHPWRPTTYHRGTLNLQPVFKMFQSENASAASAEIWHIRHVASYSSLVLEFSPKF